MYIKYCHLHQPAMDLEIMKSDRERQISCDIAYMWNIKEKDTNEFIYKIETESQP